MGIRERIAKVIAPQMRNEAEIREIVKEETTKAVTKARMALPVTASYDPNNEGYRRMMGGQQIRDLYATDQDRMLQVAYFMWDNSAMTRGMALMDKAFMFGEPISVTCEDDDVGEVVLRFLEDSDNNVLTAFPEWMLWYGLLGEQCWPVTVNPHNGHVTLGYEDPAGIKSVFVSGTNKKLAVQVAMQGTAGRPGKKYATIRVDKNFRSKTYGRLVGDCFFFAMNKPPNSPRGRSDFLTLFDWIDGLERYGYNYLERAEFLLNFVWDVLLKGMNEDQIREWLQNNSAPDPGSLRAHNENVEWNVVAPDMKAHDVTKGFDMGKSFIMGAARRPDSWWGGGGKAYQTEAEQFGQVPIKDLDERQRYYKSILEFVIRFQVDQAVIAGRLSEEKAATGFEVSMPEISKKDLTKLINGVPQLATALAVAETNGWIMGESAAKIFATIMGQLGVEIDVQAEMEAAREKTDDGGQVTEDYRD